MQSAHTLLFKFIFFLVKQFTPKEEKNQYDHSVTCHESHTILQQALLMLVWKPVSKYSRGSLEESSVDPNQVCLTQGR